jgi:cytochrome c oxidase cbb3-type subunit 2
MARSIHTSHRAILGLAAGIYLVLVVVVAVLPASAMAKAYPPKPRDEDNAVLQSIARGRALYRGYGCHYCHTQQVRGDERLAVKGRVPVLPVDRRFGLDVASSPEDYASDDPPFLGTQRTGPDLTTVGSRLPSVDWHYWHLYDPRAVSPESVMPAMRWLFKTSEEERAPEDVDVRYIDSLGIPSGKLYATPDAQDLVAYILSLTRSDQPR